MVYSNFSSDLHWASNLNTAKWKAWSGLSFENICLYHASAIKHALGLSGIATSMASWHHNGNATMAGVQIDLIISRADNGFHICEIKFNSSPIVFTKKMAQAIKLKVSAFNYFTTNSKTVFCKMITAGGIITNVEFNDTIHSHISLNDLFY